MAQVVAFRRVTERTLVPAMASAGHPNNERLLALLQNRPEAAHVQYVLPPNWPDRAGLLFWLARKARRARA